ncbi:MAG TPA: class I SAM-dependent methyltransferase [Ensifer sp.]|nr:class I SAM-dependent methyltransferase [Ensifer sp.]
MLCRLCQTDCGSPLLDFPSPSIVSTTAILDAPTTAYVCPSCGHVQKPDFTEVASFYDQSYRISLDSGDHDQLYAVVDGQPIYRTQFQAELASRLLGIGSGMAVLDYGCGKAATLERIMQDIPGITPAVFDISSSYKAHWDRWVAPGDQAMYRVPAEWSGRFDRVMAHFVLEHATDPQAVFSEIARVLAPDGKAFVSVPNVFGNPGDLLVVDHVNHFTPASLSRAASDAGLTLESLSDADYRGAYVAIFVKGQGNASPTGCGDIRAIAADWRSSRARIIAHAEAHPGADVEIYGAGFYGAFIAMLVRDRQRVLHFLDRNPFLQGTTLLGIPVRNPDDVLGRPAHETPATLYAGLNPAVAATVMDGWCAQSGRDPLSVVYI